MNKDYTKFKEATKTYLFTRSIGDLRIYGREMGVFRSTDRKKEDLIDQIVGIWTKEIEPIERNKKGAPIKNNVVPPEIPKRINELYEKYVEKSEVKYKDKNVHFLPKRIDNAWNFEDGSGIKIEYVNGMQVVYFGQVYEIGEECLLLSLNGKGGLRLRMEREMAEYYRLRIGDVITFFGERLDNVISATEVLTINDVAIPNCQYRVFDDLIACYPYERIRFSEDQPTDTTTKYLDWLLPIGKGQRICVFGAPKSGKSTLLCKMAQNAKRYNKGLYVFVALIDQAPEDVGQYRKVVDKNNFVSATYEEEPDEQVFLADMMLTRAKAYAESRKDVLLIVDSIGGVAKAYNETEESTGGKTLPCGLESKTLRYVKKFLGAGRCFEEGGSITVVSALSTETGNPMDEVLEQELSTVANVRLYLSNALAMKRIYPAIDYRKTDVKECGLLQISEEIEFENFLRTQYLEENGAEKFNAVLEESNTYIQLKEKVYQ